MIEKDTVRLLRECDAGIKMGVDSINDVLDYVGDKELYRLLKTCGEGHERLGDELRACLERYGDEGKDPNPMARGMSWVKTEVMLKLCESDETVADLMTDGCNLGVKSLSKYLNKYKAADEKSKSIAKRLIALEEDLSVSMRAYL